MTLKNRDGTEYKLRGPNPLMKTQTTWEEDIKVHNMKFQSETQADEREVQTIDTDFNLRDDFTQLLQKTKPEPKVVEVKPEPKIEVKPEPERFVPEPEQPRKKSTIPDHRKVFMWCLPAIMKDRRDGMYGQKYQTIKYEKPFSFEGVIVEEHDMKIAIWTSAAVVTSGSVIYPKKNFDGVADAQRWWRVQEVSQKNDGWLLIGYPSDHTPSFES